MKRMTVVLVGMAAAVAMASGVWACSNPDCGDYSPDVKEFIRLACGSENCPDHHIDVRGLLRLACTTGNCVDDDKQKAYERVALAPNDSPAAGAIAKGIAPSSSMRQEAKSKYSLDEAALERIQKADAKDFPVLTAFLNKRIPVNAKDQKGNTLLYYFAAKGDAPAVQYLLSKGADPKCTNKNGCTPVDCAKTKGHADVVRILEAAGITK